MVQRYQVFLFQQVDQNVSQGAQIKQEQLRAL